MDTDTTRFITTLYGIRRSAWAIALIIRYTGLHFSDAWAITNKNLVWNNGSYWLSMDSMMNGFVFEPCHPMAIEPIKYLSRCRKRTYPTVIDRSFKKAAQVTGIPLNIHNFRHMTYKKEGISA